MSARFTIVKKCLEAMSDEQQDQIIDNCVTIVTNGANRAIPVSRKALSKPTVGKAKVPSTKGKTKGRANPLTIKGVEYKSFANFCDQNKLKKSTVYKNYKKIKTPVAKVKFLESCLDS